jgi:peptide/nickel transport system permease protein
MSFTPISTRRSDIVETWVNSKKRQAQSRWRTLRYVRGRWEFVFALLLLCPILVMGIFASVLAPYDPNQLDTVARLSPPTLGFSGLGKHLLGTDQLGRDELSRMMYGTTISLTVGAVSVLFAGTLGLVLGMVAGYRGGWIDAVIMRVVDVVLSFPYILLAISIVAVLGASLRNIIIVFALSSWVVYARTVRGVVLGLRNKEYVVAARTIGCPGSRIMFRHLLPNVVSPLTVIASFELARIIVAEATLGFLGLGVPPPAASWGSMLADGRNYIQMAWWIGTFPGLALTMAVLGINIFGDALRDALDPRLRRG